MRNKTKEVIEGSWRREKDDGRENILRVLCFRKRLGTEGSYREIERMMDL